MNNILIRCLILLGLLWAVPPFAQQTQIQYLSGTDKDNTLPWDFKVNGGRNSGSWSRIPVPSNWEMQGFGSYRYFIDWGDNPAPDTEGLYRTRFSVPENWRDQHINIVFGGVMTDAEVKINGQLAGPVHRGGFYQFSYDISPSLKPGEENLLEVKVNRFSADESVNRAERKADFWLFSGIYRPVWLEAKPREHIQRLAVDARHTGDIQLQLWLNNADTANNIVAQVSAIDGEKRKKVGQFSAKIAPGAQQLSVENKIKKIIPWSAENPQRYQLQVQLRADKKVIHQVEQVIGFRSVELRKGDGLYVNEVKVRLKGANRHSFWPDSGRTTSKTLSYADARLLKEMNMNAVRVAHYPPDQHFLDVADELGLYVINELTGWQEAYSTEAGTPLVKELILRDHNHPSVIIWANGNEGGWNTELDDDFAQWDTQARPLIHPWGLFGGINTAHYEPLNCCAGRLFDGEDVFMPTEFLHGLYDGGAGAGLNDWWNKMLANPLSAGGFIWAFADEGIVRADRAGKIDVAGNSAPDGIVGPYRQKEGSFFAIKEIWSPVYFPLAEQEILPASFNGKLMVENRYEFTGLDALTFRWQLVEFPLPRINGTLQNQAQNKSALTSVAEGEIKASAIAPGERGFITADLPENWQAADAFYLTAYDKTGAEIYRWSWMIASPQMVIDSILPASVAADVVANKPSEIAQAQGKFNLVNGDLQVQIDSASGLLHRIVRGTNKLSFNNGPRLLNGTGTLTGIRGYVDQGDAVVSADFNGELCKIEWRLQANGWLKLTYAYQMKGGTKADYLGVTFDYPETQVKSMRWLGKGPYRVWKNRTKGVEYGVWEKAYNDTVTGLEWNYPEFKGFHDHVYWAELATTELPLVMVINDPNINLRLLTPRQASGESENPMTTKVTFPEGNISLLHGFAPIGTKFHQPANHGAEGELNQVPRLGQWYQTEVYFYIGQP
ncbi:glycoside hydrolase [Cellvibrio sp. BR]|uniref:glycoside hydrolase family 2 protein n=1 Tax=Cellvibrio sp. BR TaxID=1134474 RepID=UPI000260099F|nr:glycoside hydrolase family 2 TIM barrel-domain containing protein [Cellvibrio sp. BR]EIK43115.1 glycoside hydrolase [Cellvibrio sp. BR]